MNLKQELRSRSKNFEHLAPQVTIKEVTARGLVRLYFTNDMHLPLRNETTADLGDKTRRVKQLEDPLEIIRFYEMIRIDLIDPSE